MLSGQRSIIPSQCNAIDGCIMCTIVQETTLWRVMTASRRLKAGLSGMHTRCVASLSREVAHAAHNGGSVKEDNSS